MAQSPLYQKALTALGRREGDWKSLRRRISSVSGLEPLNRSGRAMVRTIQEEQQLSGDPASAEPAYLVAALTALCDQTGWPTGEKAFCDRFEETVKCAPHVLQGQPLRGKPAELRRYCNGPGLFKAIARALRRNGNEDDADELEALIREAERGTPGATWGAVTDYLGEPEVWDAARGCDIALSGCESTFVTFDARGAPLRKDSARWMHAALALWIPMSSCFIELRYRRRKGDELRFPTFADAGWFRHFRGAPLGAPHGWTHPHLTGLDPPPSPQPEAVQARPTLARVEKAEDLRVMLP